MKTATDEPVQIVGRTKITPNVSQCILRFPVFVARGLGNCCILGNDFRLQFNTVINFSKRLVQFETMRGRVITVKFLSREREAKYLKPPPDPTWLNQIQLEDFKSPTIGVRCADAAEVPPRSHRLLRITYDNPLPSLGIIEPRLELFNEKSILVPRGLSTNPPPEQLMVVNFSAQTRSLAKGEVLAEICEADGVKEDYIQKEGREEGEEDRVDVKRRERLEENELDINPNLASDKRRRLVELLREFQDRFSLDRSQIGKTTVCELEIALNDSEPVHQPPYRVSHRENDILTYLNGCKWFCTLDLNSGYWQIPIREEDKSKTAFITPDGLWESQVTPFGLKTSPAVFLRCMPLQGEDEECHRIREAVESPEKAVSKDLGCPAVL
ncbi:uncharacterized protein LOC128998872 [Macrosteles quadrilineatus]|uniref:uncharacterized protein LOC128998872 n=1 Tax=Macrosteles quadrilineatus TaxID=74068 RepID=UPI0023E1ED80|nr:uncharacterized protein LOC128998872 [Macrosteles quadrilineatus]